jgi:hypothetical protein
MRSFVDDNLTIQDVAGHAVAHLVEALRYKLQGRRIDYGWCHWNFSLT